MTHALNHAFANFATRVSFNLTLTKAQVFYLWAVKNGNAFVSVRGEPIPHAPEAPKHDIFVPSVRGLVDRGLVERTPGADGYGFWQLTEAGEKVYELLVIAGLVTAAVSASNEGKAA